LDKLLSGWNRVISAVKNSFLSNTTLKEVNMVAMKLPIANSRPDSIDPLSILLLTTTPFEIFSYAVALAVSLTASTLQSALF
jgi:hypothetical protein